MNNEIRWGVIGSILIIILTFVFASQYQNQNNNLQSLKANINNNQVSQAASVVLTLDEIAKHNQPQDC